jgi:hypothetical protein
MKKTNNKKSTHGGARANSGRRPKEHQEDLGKITCMLRRDTIEKLREGAGGRFFGEFLQRHLDRYPLPDRATYIALKNRRPIVIKMRGRNIPTIVSAGAANRIKTDELP